MSTEQDHLIRAMLAREALGSGAQTAPMAPANTAIDVRAAWQSAADELDGLEQSLIVSEIGYSRQVSYHPHRGLQVVGGGMPAAPWAEVPTGILAQHQPLLAKLLKESKRLRVRASAQLLAVQSTAQVAAQRANAKPPKEYATKPPRPAKGERPVPPTSLAVGVVEKSDAAVLSDVAESLHVLGESEGAQPAP